MVPVAMKPSTYKKGGSEGIAGGCGDQEGQPGGNPDSRIIPAVAAVSGIAIKSGLSRSLVLPKLYSYTDEFNENAKVAVDMKIEQEW